jgi:hypothetical protein
MMRRDMDSPAAPAALVVAHPGHELRVHGWLEAVRPYVFVLTDGSGACGRSRLSSTENVLQRAGARTGPIFGRLTDRAAYAAVLAHDASRFLGLAGELADFLVRQRITTVLGDAREGYNPVHDVTRSIIDAAVRMAVARGHAVRNFDFLVVGMDEARPVDVRMALDAAALARKLEAARGFTELESEVTESLARWGPAAFGVECLRPVPMGACTAADRDPPPLYERFGEERVADGRYESVLRYDEHVLPLVRALGGHLPS